LLEPPLGDGLRVTMPEANAAMAGLWIERRTVSSVCSIFLSDCAMASCFLVDFLPRFDSSKMHSWLVALQRWEKRPGGQGSTGGQCQPDVGMPAAAMRKTDLAGRAFFREAPHLELAADGARSEGQAREA
jgi:hypothetical protein